MAPPASTSDPSGVVKDLGFLRRTVRRMRAVVYDAEEADILRDSLKVWLTDLRNLALHTEDALDRYENELLRINARAQKLHDPSPSLSLISPSFWSEMETTVRYLLETFDSILKRRKDDVFPGEEDADDGDEDWLFEVVDRPPTVSGPPPAEGGFFGREKEMDDLVQLLTLGDEDQAGVAVAEEGDLDVPAIAVFGMGGIGKTTLVQQVYNDSRMKQHFDVMGWVHVSTNFDIVKITKEAAKSLSHRQYESRELNQSQTNLKMVVEGKKFLLVLDDVWNENGELWDRFKSVLRFGANGSKILITARDRSVAATARAIEFPLNQLRYEHCWSIFLMHAFGSCSDSQIPKFKLEIGQQIVWKCGGLPLAVRVLGSLLSGEDDRRRWNEVLNNDLCKLKEGEEELLGPLRLSYLYLPSYLKACFTYCAVFPKGHEIDKEELVLLWMAEGLIQYRTGERSEDTGMEYINYFLSRSFLQPALPYHFMFMSLYTKKSSRKVLMHDLFHNLAQKISGEECLMIKDNKSSNLLTIFRHASICCSVDMMEPLPFPTASYNRPRSFSMIPFKQPISFFMTPYLRSCLVFYGMLYPEIDTNLELYTSRTSGSYFCLRVLDLSSTSIKDLPASIGNLNNLRYLAVGYTKLSVLPKSICMLYNLQTLILRATLIQEMPVLFGNLKCLRYLDLSSTRISIFPESICTLSDLQTLNLGNLGMKDLSCSVFNLLQLRHLNLTDTRLQVLPTSICELNSLEELDLSGTYVKELPISIGNLKRLRNLWLGHSIRNLPDSICKLIDLQSLNLSSCKELEKLPKDIGKLNKLRELTLDSDNIFYLPSGIGRLTKLEKLEHFALGNSEEHAGITELKDLVNLTGSLKITGLCNVPRAKDAEIASLRDKMHIKRVTLDWAWKSRGQLVLEEVHEHIAQNQEEVLNSLRFHANLEELNILNYAGSKLSEWVGDPYFIRLSYMKFHGCRCRVLPQFRLLSSLSHLSIAKMPFLISIQVPALQELKIRDCEKFESIESLGAAISEVKIFNCPRLCFSLPIHFPSTIKLLEIRKCPLLTDWCYENKQVVLSHAKRIILDGVQNFRGKSENSDELPTDSDDEL